MRHRRLLVVAGSLCLAPLLGQLMLAQQAPPPAAPAGRGRGGQAAGQTAGQRGARPPGPPPGQSTNITRRLPKESGPAPRDAKGHIMLDGLKPGDKGGLWTPIFGILDPILEANKVPFQPWARGLYDYRQANEFEPHSRCKPSGVAREFQTPYGVEIVELTDLQRVFIYDVGGPHTFRTIYMDGRPHPQKLEPSAYGHSVGHWDGDTLVVDTVGFNEKFWLDRRGLPSTDQMHTTERFTRISELGMKYEATIDDPGAYTAPWTGWFYLGFSAGEELYEYVCQENNYATSLLVGSLGSVSRGTTIVP
jgi:hypothetical protein